MFRCPHNDILFIYFKGVNVIYRTRELEEKQAKRYYCVLALCYGIYWLLIGVIFCVP